MFKDMKKVLSSNHGDSAIKDLFSGEIALFFSLHDGVALWRIETDAAMAHIPELGSETPLPTITRAHVCHLDRLFYFVLEAAKAARL